MSSSSHVVLITGANTGIGLETVRALSKSSQAYTIILAGRTPSKVDSAIEDLKKEFPNTKSTYEAVQLEVTSDESIKAAVKTVSAKHDHIDTLINNAGASFDYDLWKDGKVSMREAWNLAWDVNVTGAQIVTWEFAGLLVKSESPRLVFMTSGTASLTETFPEASEMPHLVKSPSAGWPKTDLGFDVSAYRSAKVGLNMMMRQWVRILKEDGVKVFCISPGFLATGLGNQGEEGRKMLEKMGAGHPSKGGEFLQEVVEGKRDESAGFPIRSNARQDW